MRQLSSIWMQTVPGRRCFWAANLVLAASLVASPASAKTDAKVASGWEGVAERLDTVFAPYDKPYSTGGSVIVLKGRDVVVKASYGQANREWNVPWTSTTKFWIASISKSFTTQVVLRLVDEGKIDLDAPVTRYLPDFPRYKSPLLVWHLLAMRSGVREESDSLQLSSRILGGADGGPGMTEDEHYRFVTRQAEPDFEPGSENVSYEDVNFGILQRIVEKVSGRDYGRLVEDYILKPLRLKDTSVPEFNHFWSTPNDAATAYISSSIDNLPYTNQDQMTFYRGTGVLVSTPRDIASWAAATAYGAPGQAAVFDRMANPAQVLAAGNRYSWYGFGMRRFSHRGIDLFGHGGIVGTSYYHSPKLGVTVVIFTNERTRFDTYALQPAIWDAILQTTAEGRAAAAATAPGLRDYAFPGDVSPKALAARTQADMATVDGVFVDDRDGYVLLSYVRSADKQRMHSLIGTGFGLIRTGPRAWQGRTYLGGALDVASAGPGVRSDLLVSGAGVGSNRLFRRSTVGRPTPAEAGAVVGRFYSDEWDALFTVVRTAGGGLELRTGDRSVAGQMPMRSVGKGVFILDRGLADGDFAVAKFDDQRAGRFDHLTFSTFTARKVSFRRLVEAR